MASAPSPRRDSRAVPTHLDRTQRSQALRPASDLAIDLGTVTTRVLVRGQGLVVDDETIAARDPRRGHIVATGVQARELVATEPRLELVRPVIAGAVADQRAAQDYLSMILKTLGSGWAGRTDVLATVSSGATPVERRALKDACRRAGAARVRLIEKSVAAALGAGTPVHDPAATLVVELGGGTTEAALMSLGSVVASSATRHGNADIDDSLRSALRHQYGLRITDVSAERMKRAIDGAPSDALVEARGVMMIDGSSTTAIFESSELNRYFESHADQVVEVVKSCLTQTTPEMASDVIGSGMLLTGGPAKSAALARRLSEELGIGVRVPEEARLAAVLGAGKCLEAVESLSSLFVSERS